jgi:hypothetical protein
VEEQSVRQMQGVVDLLRDATVATSDAIFPTGGLSCGREYQFLLTNLRLAM